MEKLKAKLIELGIKNAGIKKRYEERMDVIEDASKTIMEANDLVKATQETKDNAAQELFFLERDLADIAKEIADVKEDLVKAFLEEVE